MNRLLLPSLRAASVLALAVLVGCGGEAAPPKPPLPPPTTASVAPPVASAPTPDALGPRPETPTPPPFLPPAPEVFGAVNGMTVWLLERHQVPIVSCSLTVPTGASSDPKGKAGLAYATAGMLDEGAGKLGALQLSAAIDSLGARISTDANADASFVSLTVLKSNLDRAFAIFGDVVARPRFEPAEFKRVKDLWQNALLERQKDPDATARVVYRVVLFGPDSPYGHPWDGTTKSAKAIGLEDIKGFYRTAWRPDRATIACAGDVTKSEITSLVDGAFRSWKAPPGPPPVPLAPGAPTGPWPKLVFVDRPEAPQSVIAALKVGLKASSPEAPALWRVNDAIGGSFTSRLNQDLREKRGYTYGARSRFSMSRGVGQVVSWANVVTDKTGDALSAMMAVLNGFATEGLTSEEVDRTKSQARGELVGSYSSVESIAGHLAGNASLGLPPDFEAKASEMRDAAQKADLNALARQFYDPNDAIMVVVGPRAKVMPMIDKLGLPAPELRDADGNVVHPQDQK